MGLILGLAPPVFKVPLSFSNSLAPKIKLATGLKGQTHTKSSLSLNLFGKLILTKIIATGCQILRLKCSTFDFRWGSAQTPLGELKRSPDP